MTKPTESWADWILSSYSESVNPPPTEALPTPDPESLEASDSSPPDDDLSFSSPWAPYTKTGRGGAGNFQWQSDLAHHHHHHHRHHSNNDDLEAQPSQHQQQARQPSSSTSETISRTSDIPTKKRRPANIMTGRGGTGNVVPAATYYTTTGTPRSPTTSWPMPISPTSSPSSTTPRSASAVYGRGGAGNFAASSLALAQLKVEEDERRMAEDLREKAEHDVEGMLRPPEDAFLAGARRRESAVGLY